MVRYIYIGGRLMPSSPDMFSVSVTELSDIRTLSGGGIRVGHADGVMSLTVKFLLPYDAKKAEFIDGEYNADMFVSFLQSCVRDDIETAVVAEDDGGNVLSSASFSAAVSELSFSYGDDAVSVTLKGRCI